MYKIVVGHAKIIVAAAQGIDVEAPHAEHLRAGTTYGLTLKLVDDDDQGRTTDAFYGYDMGKPRKTCAPVAVDLRQTQDKLPSRPRTRRSRQKVGKFKDEIVAVTVKGRKGDTIVDQDESIPSRRDAGLRRTS